MTQSHKNATFAPQLRHSMPHVDRSDEDLPELNGYESRLSRSPRSFLGIKREQKWRTRCRWNDGSGRRGTAINRKPPSFWKRWRNIGRHNVTVEHGVITVIDGTQQFIRLEHDPRIIDVCVEKRKTASRRDTALPLHSNVTVYGWKYIYTSKTVRTMWRNWVIVEDASRAWIMFILSSVFENFWKRVKEIHTFRIIVENYTIHWSISQGIIILLSTKNVIFQIH